MMLDKLKDLTDRAGRKHWYWSHDSQRWILILLWPFEVQS
jgi:hypothetical protein